MMRGRAYVWRRRRLRNVVGYLFAAQAIAALMADTQETRSGFATPCGPPTMGLTA